MVVDRRQPHLETDRATERQGKRPWKGIRLSGSVEADFLFATLLSDNMLPFGWRQLSLVVLPVRETKDHTLEMIDARGAIRRGMSGLADWLRKAGATWEEHRKSPVELLDYLNYRQKLTRQHSTSVIKLLYSATGSYLCACVVDASDMAGAGERMARVRGASSRTTKTGAWKHRIPEKRTISLPC